MLIRTTGVEDFLSNGHAVMKALVMGPPSAGKTRSASFWPRPIFADCEKGRMSLADRNVPYAEITHTTQMDALLRMLAAECLKPYDARQFQTFVVDTLDSYQRMVMQERLDAENKAAFSGWQDWGYLDGKMTQLVAKLHTLDMNIVVNLHTKSSQIGDDDAKYEVIGPKLKGDMKDQIAGDFDLVGYMGTYYENKDGERVLARGIQWHPEPSRPILKDRSGQLPKFTPVNFTDQDYTGLYTAIIGGTTDLTESTVVLELETDPVLEDVAPVPPSVGGPVDQPATTPPAAATKAAPKTGAVARNVPPAAKPAPAEPAQAAGPAQAAAPTAPETTTPVVAEPPAQAAGPATETGASSAPVAEAAPAAPVPASAPAPVPAPEAVSHEEGVATVTEALGATEVAPPAPPAEPVTQAAAPADVTPTEVAAVFCGTSWPDGGEGSVPGCGKQIITTKQGGTDNADVMEIAAIRTRTNLCEACFAAHKATTN